MITMPGNDTNQVVFMHRPDLFRTTDGKPMYFSMRPCFERSLIRPPITHGGGEIGLFNKPTKCSSQVIRLVTPECSVFTGDCYSSMYIWDCVAANKLMVIDDYKKVEEIVEQENGGDDESDDSNYILKTNPRRRQCSTPYSRTEDVEIVAFIIKERAFRYIAGNELWKRMEKDLRLQNMERSWESLKNRFKKKILPNILSYTDDKTARESFEERRDLISRSDSNPVYIPKSNYFTSDDDYSILNYIKTTDMCHLNGCDIWKRMQSNKITQHSWQSMKNRFKRQIVVNLDKYEMSENDRARFQRAISNSKPGMNHLDSREDVSYPLANKRLRVLPLNEHSEMRTENEHLFSISDPNVNSSRNPKRLIITASTTEPTISHINSQACRRPSQIATMSEKGNFEYSTDLPQCSAAGTSGPAWINMQPVGLRKPDEKRNLTSKMQLPVLFVQTSSRCQTSEKLQNAVDVLSLSRIPTPLIKGNNAEGIIPPLIMESDVASFNHTNNDGIEQQTSIKLDKNVGSSGSVVYVDTFKTAELNHSVVEIESNQISEQVLTIDDHNASNDYSDITDRTTVEIIQTPVAIALSDPPEKDVAVVVDERINEGEGGAIEEKGLPDRRIFQMHTNVEIVSSSNDFALNFIGMGIKKELDSWMESPTEVSFQAEHVVEFQLDVQESHIEKSTDADRTKLSVTVYDSDVRDNSDDDDDDEPEGIYEGWPDGLKKILLSDTTRLQIEEIFQVLKWCGLRLNMKNHHLLRFLQAMYAHDADKLLHNFIK